MRKSKIECLENRIAKVKFQTNDGTEVALNSLKQSCYENVWGGGFADDKR